MLPQRKRTRLAGFDYSSDRLYFITCCVKHMRHCFGQVVDGRMQLNDYGAIADAQWLWLAEQYSYVKLHAHIVMPNHMHGILEIDSRGAGSAGGVRATRVARTARALRTQRAIRRGDKNQIAIRINGSL